METIVAGLEIAQERARIELYATDHAHIAATCCPMCGCKMYSGQCAACGYTNYFAHWTAQDWRDMREREQAEWRLQHDIIPDEISPADLAMYDEEVAACKRAAGNHTEEEVQEMRHPTW